MKAGQVKLGRGLIRDPSRRLTYDLCPLTLGALRIPVPTLTPSKLKRRWAASDHGQRRELIIDVAVQLLHRHGLSAMTMRGVAQRLGVGTMTLYTYIEGQDELRHAITQRGFDKLADGCQAASTLGTAAGWGGGARHYLQFALDNPNLYKLMFATEIDPGDADEQILHRGFQPLFDRVREQMAERGMSPDEIDQKALLYAGRFWIALHGLASLALAGRLSILHAELDQLLDSLLERVAPT